MRLEIPPWMTGGAFKESKDTQFERKTVSKCSKPSTTITEEQAEQMLQETRCGFSHQSAAPSQQALAAPLPKGAITAERKDELQSGRDLLMSIATSHSLAEPIRAGGPDGKADAAAQGQCASFAQGEFVNVSSQRNKAAATLGKDIKSQVTRVENQAKLAAITLRHEATKADTPDFWNDCEARMHAVCEWMGKTIDWPSMPANNSKPGPDDLTWVSRRYDEVAEPATAAGADVAAEEESKDDAKEKKDVPKENESDESQGKDVVSGEVAEQTAENRIAAKHDEFSARAWSLWP